jgi:SAM-dependent methyltransferase
MEPIFENVLQRRLDYVSKQIDLTKHTLEVAPYFNPSVSRVEGHVWYTDYISNAEIQEKASQNPGLGDRRPQLIDFVWIPGAPLAECAGRYDFDFLVASHVLEHVPDPIGWLNELLSVLKVGGTVVLVLPDKRLSFDFYRPETTFAEVVDLAIENPSAPLPRQVLDFMTGSITDYGDFPYEKGLPFEDAKRSYTDDEAIQTAIWAKTTKGYLDVHATVWTPASFEKVFRRIVNAGLLNVDISSIVENRSEFLLCFKKLGEPKVRLAVKPLAPEVQNINSRSLETHKNVDHQLCILRHDLGLAIEQTRQMNLELRGNFDAGKSFEHQLGILRHDLGFSIEQIKQLHMELRIYFDASKPKRNTYRTKARQLFNKIFRSN